MTKRKKKRVLPQKQKQREIVVGVTWYTPEQFALMKSVADDAESLDDTHEDWLKNASRLVKTLKKGGYQVVEVPIDTDEWVKWCLENGNLLNGAARSTFVSQKVSSGVEASSLSDQFVSRQIKPRPNPIPFLDELETLFETERDRSVPPPYPFDPKNNLIRIPKEVEDHLRQLVRSGQKIEAVHQVTKLTGAGLRISKDYVDSLVP